MAYYIDWLIEDRIIYFYIHGTLSSEDTAPVDAQITKMLEASQCENIHVLFDDGGIDKMPGFAETRKLTYPKHPRLGWVFMSAQKPVHRLVAGIMGQVMKTRFRFVDSPQEGLRMLTGIEDEIDKLEEWQALLTEKQAQTRVMIKET